MSARASLGLDRDRPTLLVTGGSLGAQRLNETFGAAARDLRAAGVQVLHVSGTGKHVDVEPAADGQAPYVVLPYADRMDEAYLAADLVVCRAGANTVCELATVDCPRRTFRCRSATASNGSIAEPVVAAGGGLLVDDADCTPAWVRRGPAPAAGRRRVPALHG